MEYLIGSCIIAAAWAGVLLTLVLLPGMWITVLVVLIGQLVAREPLMSWWTVGAIALIAAVGEVVETFASAAGAKRFGASKAGMTAAVVGSFVGALAGTILLPFLPVLGTLAGALLGAGLSTIVVERGMADKTWKQSAAAGGGAAAGRALAVVGKVSLAALQATVLTVAVLVP